MMEETMNFANTRWFPILWIGAFFGALSLHVALGAQFYFRSTGVKNGIASPIVTLTFAQEFITFDGSSDLSDTGTDSLDIDTEPELLQPVPLEQDLEILEAVNEVQPEEPQHPYEKDDFTILKSVEEPFPHKIEHKISVKKPISKAIVKQYKAKEARSSPTKQVGNAAMYEDALFLEWLTKVQAQLEKQKKYVVGQRTSRANGTVKLEFRVNEQGSIFSSRVVIFAGDPELNRLALVALQRVGSFPPPPPSKANKIIRVSLIFS